MYLDRYLYRGQMTSTTLSTKRRLLLFHKPKGLIVSRSDERGRKTVYNHLPAFVLHEGWVPVGRLDKESRGLLLFTREGSLVEKLTRPGRCPKFYELWVRGQVTDQHLVIARKGVDTTMGALRVHRVKRLGGIGMKTRLRVEITEGKNRHLRRLFGALRDPRHGTPLKVVDLKRTGFGPLRLDVPSGNWRFLTPHEVETLIRQVEAAS